MTIPELRALIDAAPRVGWDMWDWASWDEAEPGWWELAPRVTAADVALTIAAVEWLRENIRRLELMGELP